MGRVKAAEWPWVIAFAALVMALTSVPYVVGALRSDEQWRFSGFVFGVEDGNSYLAKMQLGAHGQWLLQLSYAVEDHPPALVFLFHILLGKAAGWLAGTNDPLRLHAALALAYHAARLVFGFALLLTSYRFLAEFLPYVRQRRMALILVGLGGGLGWLLLALRAPGMPLEFYSPEAFTFLNLYGIPHLSAARTFFLGGLLFYLMALRGRWQWAFAAAAAWLALTLIQPLYMLILFAVLGAHVVILTLLALRQKEGELVRGVDAGGVAVRAWWVGPLAAAGGAPLVLYTFLLFTVSPVYRTWAAQNIILSPAPWHYVAAWGLLVVPGLFGLRPLYRRNLVLWALAVGWLLLLPVLLYAPYNLQRRLSEGAQLPLAALAVLGLTAGSAAVQRLGLGALVRRFGPPALVALSLPATGLLWVGGMATVLRPAEPVYQDRDQVATYVFLARSLPPRAAVLSSYEFGNALPAYGYLVAVMGHGPETPDLPWKQAMAALVYEASTDRLARYQSYTALGVPYVVVGPHERRLGGFDPADASQADYLVRIFQSGPYSVWSLKQSP